MTGWSSQGGVGGKSDAALNELLALEPIRKSDFEEPLVAFSPRKVVTSPEQLRRPKLPYQLTGVVLTLLSIEFFQGLGLLCTMATTEGSWPKSITDEHGWTVYTNIDVWGGRLLSAYEGNAQAIVLDDDYTPTFIAWCVVAAALLLLIVLLHALRDRLLCALRSARAFTFAAVKAVCFGLAMLFAYPIFLALLRPWLCTNSILIVNPTETCASAVGLQLQAVGTALAAIWLLGMASLVYAHVRTCAVFTCSRSHAMHIDVVEQNYGKGFDATWLEQGWYLTTAFKRSCAYFAIWLLVHKALVVAAYTILSDQPMAQGGIVFGLFLVSTTVFAACKPFRFFSANALAIVTHLALCALSLIILMRRTDGIQALLESPYLDNEVWAAVGFALAVIIAALLHALLFAVKGRRLWPSPPHVDASPPAPLAAMAEASRAIALCWESPWHLAPTHVLAACIHTLQAHGSDAALSDRVRRQVQHILDAALLCYAQVAPVSVYSQAPRASVWWCHRQLTPMMPQLRRRMDRRDDEYLLMSKHFKRYQLKMAAFLAFRDLLLRVRERNTTSLSLQQQDELTAVSEA